MRRDFLKLCGLAGLGLAVPFRAPEARAAEKQGEPYPGPYYVVFQRERRVGYDLPHGPERRQQHQPPL